MQRSEIREVEPGVSPDSAALHLGYFVLSKCHSDKEQLPDKCSAERGVIIADDGGLVTLRIEGKRIQLMDSTREFVEILESDSIHAGFSGSGSDCRETWDSSGAAPAV